MRSEHDADGVVEDRVHRLSVRVYHEDTDVTGVVYHASYIRFLERGRSDFLLAVGISHAMLRDVESPVAFAVRRMEIDFLSPARLEDRLIVETAFGEGGGALLPIFQRIECEGRTLIRAWLEVACVKPDGSATRPPKVLVNRLAPYRGGVLKTT